MVTPVVASVATLCLQHRVSVLLPLWGEHRWFDGQMSDAAVFLNWTGQISSIIFCDAQCLSLPGAMV